MISIYIIILYVSEKEQNDDIAAIWSAVAETLLRTFGNAQKANHKQRTFNSTAAEVYI